MRLSGLSASPDTFLLAAIVDKLSTMIWMQTRDGQRGTNRPASILERLIPKQASDINSFASGEEFELARQSIIQGVKGGP
jgi:hypothetical protein